ncbi:hypothetical protein FRB94_010333 [Tulasnella sp. JGI-2019a]|nr:hypothetical protein FRB94_010333 [Tulasnella sp. JGI-2019a]KAG8997494.1 hypothetical protein FRB93_014105 [Tulasnella sp. JGI-2019a]
MSTVPMRATSADFSFGERLGLVFIVMVSSFHDLHLQSDNTFGLKASCLSITSILVLLVYVIILAIRRRRSSNHSRHLLRHGADYYILSLFAFDVMQATGRAMHIVWIRDARVTSGAYCIAQSVLEQVGSVGTALMTLAIGVTSFAIIVLRWPNSASKTIPTVVHAVVITLLILFIVVPTQLQRNYYGPVGFWCWISSDYKVEQITLQYMWFWTAGFVNIILYILIFLALRGNLFVTFNSEATNGWGRGSMRINWERNRNRRASAATSEERKRLMRTARHLLAYPVVYTITVLPMSIVRWLEFTHPHRNTPFEAVAFSAVVYTSSGFFNVILYTVTHWRFLTRSNERQITAVVELTTKSESHGVAGLSTFGPGNLEGGFSGITDGHTGSFRSYSTVERSSHI